MGRTRQNAVTQDYLGQQIPYRQALRERLDGALELRENWRSLCGRGLQLLSTTTTACRVSTF